MMADPERRHPMRFVSTPDPFLGPLNFRMSTQRRTRTIECETPVRPPICVAVNAILQAYRPKKAQNVERL